MKKLVFTATACCLMASLCTASPLTEAEYSTIGHMKAYGIFSNERTDEEWRQPMRTIDVASAVIKSDSLMLDLMTSNHYSTNRRISLVERMNTSMHSDISKLQTVTDEHSAALESQNLFNIIMFVGLVASFIF